MSKIKSPPAPQPAAQNNLFITVKTFDRDTGKDIGFRCVDLYHFGTTRWMQSHNWWAMQNGHVVEIATATPPEIAAYLEAGKAALADKFNSKPDLGADNVEQHAKDAAGEPAAAKAA